MNNGTLEIEFKSDDSLVGLTHSDMVGRKNEAEKARINVLMSETFAKTKQKLSSSS